MGARVKRVVYVGNFQPDHSTENDVRRAFEHLGWHVDTIQERDFAETVTGGLDQALADEMGSVDLVLHTMTQGSYPDPDAVTELWAWCADLSVPTASIHLDLFYGLASPKDAGPQRCDLPRLHPMFRVAHVFTADGGHQDDFVRDGVNHHWLPPAVRHDEARRIEPDDQTAKLFDGIDVAFVGAKGYHPEWPHRPELVDRLRERYGARFVHVGPGGDLDTIRGERLNMLYAQVPVIVGDYCFAHSASRYWSDRFPEVWGRGGFLVFPHTEALEEQVGPYPCWRVGDWASLFEKVDYFVANPEIRDEWRGMLQPKIAAEHTYVNRVQTMLDTIAGVEDLGRPSDGPNCPPALATSMRRFELHRDVDETGVSGTGVVAQGVEFDDGTVAMKWLGDWPTSVVFHERGAEALEHVHGHGGKTRVVWLDEVAS